VLTPNIGTNATRTCTRMAAKLFVGGLLQATTSQSLREHFEMFGEIEECYVLKDPVTFRSRGFGYVRFTTDKSAQVAMREVLKVDGKTVDVQLPKEDVPESKHSNYNPSKVFVGGIPPEVTEEDLVTYFSKFGEVTSANIPFERTKNRHRGFGYVLFLKEESVTRCLALYFGHRLGGKWIEIKRCVPRDKIRYNPCADEIACGPPDGSQYQARDAQKKGWAATEEMWGGPKGMYGDGMQKPYYSYQSARYHGLEGEKWSHVQPVFHQSYKYNTAHGNERKHYGGKGNSSCGGSETHYNYYQSSAEAYQHHSGYGDTEAYYEDQNVSTSRSSRTEKRWSTGTASTVDTNIITTKQYQARTKGSARAVQHQHEHDYYGNHARFSDGRHPTIATIVAQGPPRRLRRTSHDDDNHQQYWSQAIPKPRGRSSSSASGSLYVPCYDTRYQFDGVDKFNHGTIRFGGTLKDGVDVSREPSDSAPRLWSPRPRAGSSSRDSFDSSAQASPRSHRLASPSNRDGTIPPPTSDGGPRRTKQDEMMLEILTKNSTNKRGTRDLDMKDKSMLAMAKKFIKPPPGLGFDDVEEENEENGSIHQHNTRVQ